ncbi:PIN domain-containing protein [Aggregatibacter segnis]|nr:PIN domain-containing protein [Aggregatibacter segnis]
MVEFPINLQAGDSVVEQISSYNIDAYDALFLLAMREHKINNIITDDKDFLNVSSIDVYSVS